MNRTWKGIVAGATLATALAGAAAVPAAAAYADDGRLFVGHGTGSRPPQALMRAQAQAEFFAAGAGYGHCEPGADDELTFDPKPRLWEATVTLLCLPLT